MILVIPGAHEVREPGIQRQAWNVSLDSGALTRRPGMTVRISELLRPAPRRAAASPA